MTVSDRDPIEKLKDSVRQLDGLPITFHLGEQPSADFNETDLLVTSPAVMPSSAQLQIARDANVRITTEICLFVERCPGRVIGVTGTKGKSTTAALAHRMLGPASFLGGNIGKSLLPDLPRMNASSMIVLELSSYMLHWLGLMQWSPHVAVLTMLGADHIAWHGGTDAYLDAKRNIVRYMRGGGVLIRRDDALSQTFVPPPGVSTTIYPMQDFPPITLGVPGRHNYENAQAAFLATGFFDNHAAARLQRVTDFTGLPHRLQLVHESNGVRFYDDSIATIPEAAIIACDAFAPHTVIQIIGGSMKEGLSWDAMCQHLSTRCKAILTIGELGPMLAERCGKVAENVTTLAAAMGRAKRIASPGDIVMLSPGTASYDQFANFEKRGEAFAAEAQREPLPTGTGNQ